MAIRQESVEDPAFGVSHWAEDCSASALGGACQPPGQAIKREVWKLTTVQSAVRLATNTTGSTNTTVHFRTPDRVREPPSSFLRSEEDATVCFSRM